MDTECKFTGKFGRWGGEEFVGVIEDVDEERIAQFAENIRTMISEYDFGIESNVTTSIEVIEIDLTETPANAFKRLDAALYKAKAGGRSRVEIG